MKIAFYYTQNACTFRFSAAQSLILVHAAAAVWRFVHFQFINCLLFVFVLICTIPFFSIPHTHKHTHIYNSFDRDDVDKFTD